MASSIGSSQDLNLLETAYQIGRFIHSHVTDDVYAKGDKPWSDYPGHFCSGPNQFYNQTKHGLILEGYYGMPSKIHTPYGYWSILGSGSGDWEKVMKAIKEPLGLVKFIAGHQTKWGYIGPFWFITKWNGKKIETFEYRKQSEYVPSETVKQIWEQFLKIHPDIEKKKIKSKL